MVQGAARNLLFLFFTGKSRFLVGRRGDLLGMTGSTTERLLETNNKQILRADYSRVFKSRSALRCAQDDMIIGFYSSLLESRTPVHYHERRNDGVSEGLHQL